MSIVRERSAIIQEILEGKREHELVRVIFPHDDSYGFVYIDSGDSGLIRIQSGRYSTLSFSGAYYFQGPIFVKWVDETDAVFQLMQSVDNWSPDNWSDGKATAHLGLAISVMRAKIISFHELQKFTLKRQYVENMGDYISRMDMSFQIR